MRKIPVLLAAVLTLGLLSAAPQAHAADRDCGDFKTQRAAQKFFKNHRPKQDPHRLDRDGDGKACESNPCPCGLPQNPGPNHPPKRKVARVIRVVDGDTVKVKIPRRHRRPLRRTVRMIGLDTPEVYGGRECGGKKASRSLKRMLPRRTRVILVRDRSQANRDRYGRILRYVIRTKGRNFDVNRRQIWRGWAKVYVYRHDRFNRVRSYRKAFRSAKRHNRGVHRICRRGF